MKVSTILSKSLKLMETSGWTQGVFARNQYRHEVRATSPSAVKFCAYGAICNVVGVNPNDIGVNEGEVPVLKQSCDYLRKVINFEYIDDFNDEAKKFEDVRRAFKKAIKLAKADQA